MASNVRTVTSDFYGHQLDFKVDENLLSERNSAAKELQGLEKTSGRLKKVIAVLVPAGAGSVAAGAADKDLGDYSRFYLFATGIISSIAGLALWKFPLASKKREILEKKLKLKRADTKINRQIEIQKMELARQIIEKTPTEIQMQMRGRPTQLTVEEITDIKNQMLSNRLEEIGKKREGLLSWIRNIESRQGGDNLFNAELELTELDKEERTIQIEMSQGPSLIIAMGSKDAMALMGRLELEEEKSQ